MSMRRGFVVAVFACLGLAVVGSPLAAKPKTFLGSEDAQEEGEPQSYLPDYGKLVEGQDADWVYFPKGALKSYKKVGIGDIGSNAKAGHRTEAQHAADYVPEYLQEWLEDQGFEVVESGADMVIEGNVFDAWEPSGGARFWGGWMANPGAVTEMMGKQKGEIVFEMRQRSRGSTTTDAVENGIEKMTEELKKHK
jgi:hypothetical protein